MNQEQLEKVRAGKGFIAALDQSGGSTPKALQLYGVGEDAYSNDDEMFDRIHEMRSRIITSPSFTGERVLGAILFEDTMDRADRGRGHGRLPVGGQGRRAVPEGRQGPGRRGRRRPGDEADARPRRAPRAGGRPRACSAPRCARSSSWPTRRASQAVVDQQFEVGRQILGRRPGADHRARGRHPQPAEGRGRGAAEGGAPRPASTRSPAGQQVMFKLTLPEEDGFYADLVAHPKVLPRSSPSPAATPARRPTTAWPATRA